jgi:hypothetical protein
VLSRLPFEQAAIIRGAIDLEFSKYGRVGWSYVYKIVVKKSFFRRS